MEESDTVITLIGTKLAKVGNEFIFKGAARDCEVCKLSKTCLSLNIGSRYRITSIRTGGKLECTIHDSGVCAVEVVEAPITLAVESRKAIKGSKIIHENVCTISECENYALCLPAGIKKGDKLAVMEILEDIPACAKGYSLKLVEVKR